MKMETLERLKDLLERSEGENKEVVSRKVETLLIDRYRQSLNKKYGFESERKEYHNRDWLVPLEDLMVLSKQYKFPLAKTILDYYSDESLEFVDKEEESSPVSKSEEQEEIESEEIKVAECEVDVPKEYSETEFPLEKDHFFDTSDEEDSFDSGKEFDDYCVGDEDWIEPHYESEDFFSEAVYYDRNAFRPHSLLFYHSFGYDSHRRNNLVVMDENSIIYLSGNYIHIYDVSTDSLKYLRGSGAGLGHCAKHPFEPIFAVGERGIQPLILIYDFRTLKVLRVLRGGADEGYNYLCFSPNGKWLLSQASKPDSSLTVWNWNMERIVLKQPNSNREIWKVEYNPFVFGGIIASGLQHITFWRLIETFTGLKLIPSRGKWGDREFSDIYTFCPFPNGMVISANSSNTLYVWDEDEITMEIKRRNDRPLHDDEIIYIEFKEKYEEIFTVGRDGKYKVWDYTRIEHAKSKFKDILEIQPTFHRTLRAGQERARPLSFQRVNPNDPDSEMYYMQDSRGCIWLVELAVKESLAPSKIIFQAHDGPIGDIAPSPAGYYVATVGREGRLHIYNSKNNKSLMKIQLSAPGSALLWLPSDLDSTSSIIIIGSTDGTIRIAVISIWAREMKPDEDDDFINIIQVFKPHNGAITVLSYDPHREGERIILSGSVDFRIFIYRLVKYKQDYLRLCPIGFVLLPDEVYSLTWNRNKDCFLVISPHGTITEVALAQDIPDPPVNSFEIKLPTRVCHFKSVKAEVMRNLAIERNMKRMERRRIHEKNKREYEIKLLKERKKKFAELDVFAGNLLKERELEREKLKKERRALLEEKKDAARDQSLLLKQIYQYRSSYNDSDDNTELREIKDHALSDLSTDSYKYSEKAPNIILKRFQELVEQKKIRRGLADEVLGETILNKEGTEAVVEIFKKLKEIKGEYLNDKQKPKSNQLEGTGSEPIVDSEGIIACMGYKQLDKDGIENEEIKSNSEDYSFCSLGPPEDKVIIDKLLQIIDEEISYDDLDVISEDEEVPPRFCPPGPPTLYFADYINDDCIWVSPGGYDAGLIYEYELGADEPYKCTPIAEFEDTEMSCFLYINGGYLIIGQGNGAVKIVNTNPDNFTDFSNYWVCGMHDNIRGRIKKICITYDFRHLYSIGEDSNIFFYGINLVHTKFKEKRNFPQAILLPKELRINDIIEPDASSLEDSVKQAERVWLEKQVDVKEVLLAKLQNLANKYEILFSLNHGLPESLRFPLDYFIIDEDYNKRTLNVLLNRKNELTQRLEFEVKKAKQIRDQIFNYFLNPIKTFKIYIYAHSFYCKVTTFLQAKLPVAFLMAEREVENIMFDILKKGRLNLPNQLAIKNEPVVKKKYKKKDLEIKPFVKGEDQMLIDMPRFQKSIYTKIMKRRKKSKLLENLLIIFKHKSEDNRKEFYDNMMSKPKPSDDGTYRLKCDPLYKPTHNISKEIKLYQLISTKRKIYDLITHFNEMTLKARDMKSNAAALSIKCHYNLKKMSSEFTNVVWPMDPQDMTINEPLEFPENLYLDKAPVFPHQKRISYNYKNKLYHQLYEINKDFPVDINAIESGTSTEYTPWESEFIIERKQFLISEYLKKKSLMDELLTDYDNEVRKLAVMKVEYEVKISYLKICFLKYMEELQIIRTFQLLEDEIDRKCSIFIKQKHINILLINVKKKKIDDCNFDILKSFQKCQMIATEFLKAIQPHPASLKRFVMKFFNKTWAQEIKKQQGGSEEDLDAEEEKSSSSSDEDSGPPEPDEDEIDSDDIDRLVAEQQEEFIEVGIADMADECGKELFDLTLETREKRIVFEKKIAAKKQEVNEYNEQINNIKEKVIMLQTIISIYKVKKSLILEEKHKQLSKIRTVAVLDASQMQHFDESTKTFSPMTETVLFPLYTLKNLEARKRKLKNNILTSNLDQKETLKHVQRLRLDIDYLNSKLKNIQDKIKEEKINKFGFDINVPRMEETILRRIIKDYKYDTFPFHMKFYADITRLQNELQQVHRSTAEQIKQNTFEQLQYGALLEQRRQYKEIMKKTESEKQVPYLTLKEINFDIEKLKHLLTVQNNLKESISSGINNLKFIEMPLLKKKISMAKKKMVYDLIHDKQDLEELLSTNVSIEFKTTEKMNLKRPKIEDKISDNIVSSDEEMEEHISGDEDYSEEEGSEESYYGD
ncbi:cilia- and flagella-associated protein 44 isoform X2 [Halyomorpha halys]|uniref:cilia- and flagella-associated protein 44 isoform X2 n=1 Tax=Halyomorpha halys TaxID=286706 RepID=UPI0006D4E1B0|nr:uncharacterized protein LOC106678626 isoform X2 [Halyomorpha halys]